MSIRVITKQLNKMLKSNNNVLTIIQLLKVILETKKCKIKALLDFNSTEKKKQSHVSLRLLVIGCNAYIGL